MNLFLLIAVGCSSSIQTQSPVPTPIPAPGPPPTRIGPGLVGGPVSMPSPDVCIYKMKRDYSHNVPIGMNRERTEIVSYPAPTDLITSGGKLMLPDKLHKGFWLDNRGIGSNTVFLDYTYEEYAALPEVPTVQVLMTHIIDKDPFTEIVTCGPRSNYTDLIKELNDMIDNGFPENRVGY